jgi:hypothetical protein
VSSLLHEEQQPAHLFVREASFRTENQELKRALRILYNYVCSGQPLPASFVQDADNNEGVHDIVARIRTLPEDVDGVDAANSQVALSLDGFPAGPSTNTQPETLLLAPGVPLMEAQEPYLAPHKEDVLYSDAESSMAIQYGCSLMDAGGPDATHLLDFIYSQGAGFFDAQ